MAEAAVLASVRKYLHALPARGIHSQRAILYGSHARGAAHQWSDIDLVVLAPEFDAGLTDDLIRELWKARHEAEAPIEPVACGEREWETDDSRPILEIARREGIEITL